MMHMSLIFGKIEPRDSYYAQKVYNKNLSFPVQKKVFLTSISLLKVEFLAYTYLIPLESYLIPKPPYSYIQPITMRWQYFHVVCYDFEDISLGLTFNFNI